LYPCLLLVSLSVCELGSTEIGGGGTGPTETAPAGPTESTGPTAATWPSGAAVLEGTWNGTWDTDVPQVKGTFSLDDRGLAARVHGTIDIHDTACVSNGSVGITLDGDTITIGSIQAEQPITFTGTVSGDRMSGTYDASACPPSNIGSW